MLLAPETHSAASVALAVPDTVTTVRGGSVEAPGVRAASIVLLTGPVAVVAKSDRRIIFVFVLYF